MDTPQTPTPVLPWRKASLAFLRQYYNELLKQHKYLEPMAKHAEISRSCLRRWCSMLHVCTPRHEPDAVARKHDVEAHRVIRERITTRRHRNAQDER